MDTSSNTGQQVATVDGGELVSDEPQTEATFQAAGNPAILAPANYNVSFYRDNGQTKVGTLDFNGPSMVFMGDAEDSARVFLDCVAQAFAGRLQQEREMATERAAKLCRDAADRSEQTFGVLSNPLEQAVCKGAVAQARKLQHAITALAAADLPQDSTVK